MVQAVANINVLVGGTGGDSPTKRDGGLWFQTAVPLAIEVAVIAETHDLIVGVIADRYGKGNAVGNVETSVIVHVESRLGADARSYRAPLADGTAANILRYRSTHTLHLVVARENFAATRRKLVDGSTAF